MIIDLLGMVPCKHFLEGKCRRSEEECRWSHGERVSLAQLREWAEPDYAGLGPGSVVLVQQEDLWARARVHRREEQTLVVQLEGSTGDPFTQELEKVYPLSTTDHQDSDDEKADESDENEPKDDTPEDEEEETFAPIVLSVAGGGRLGEWEGHTKGVGSALMAKMGWRGGGLGKEEEGRREPVEARLYPQGKSLDWCMERRYVGQRSFSKQGDRITTLFFTVCLTLFRAGYF